MNRSALNSLCVRVFFLVLAIPSALATPLQAQQLVYDPSLGTLPDEQGWTLYDTGESPPYRLKDGVLHQGPTSRRQYQTWENYDFALDFTQQTLVMSVTVRIIDSSYNPPPYTRGGFAFYISDMDRRVFLVHLTNNGVFLSNSGQGNSAIIPFNTRDDFHTYHLVVVPEFGALLFIDDATKPVLFMKFGPTDVNIIESSVMFGDQTTFGHNESEVAYVAFAVVDG